jgi:hypothetical protein
VPVSYRAPNEALGFTAEGLPREDTIRVCRIKVKERWLTTLDEASDQDARDEGYADLDGLLGEYERGEFWVIRFIRDDTHVPRLLAGAIVAGRQGAYVSEPHRALPDEPEAVDPDYQAELCEIAGERDAKYREQRWKLIAVMPFDYQLQVLRQEAWKRHIDIRSELRAIDRWRAPEARAKQLESIRRKLEPALLAA